MTNQTGNHTGYRQFKGTRTSAQEIHDLYQGLCQSDLTDFDVLLTGYTPSAAAVKAVGEIGLDLQRRAEKKPGSFFWSEYDTVTKKKDIMLSVQSWILSWAIRAGFMSMRMLCRRTRR